MVEITVPVGRELIVAIAAWVGERQRAGSPGCSGHRRNQVPASGRAELSSRGGQQFIGYAIKSAASRRCRCDIGGQAVWKEGVDQALRGPDGRQHRDRRAADVSSQGIAATLARALIVHVEVAPLGFGTNRSAEIAAEDVLLEHKLLQEVVVGIQVRVAEVLPKISVIAGGAAFQNSVDVAGAIAALSRIVEAG